MLRFAEMTCPNPACRHTYGVAVEDGFAAECPSCHQVNRVPGQAMSKELTGMCDTCKKPLDNHIFGRQTFCCPPENRRKQ